LDVKRAQEDGNQQTKKPSLSQMGKRHTQGFLGQKIGQKIGTGQSDRIDGSTGTSY